MKNNINFLIQDKIFEDDEDKLINCLKKKNIKYLLYPLNKFNYKYINLLDGKYIFCYGSLEWIFQIQRLNDPRLLTICNIENYRCDKYYPHFKMFNDDYEIINRSQISEKLNEPKFVRPLVGYKPSGFTGCILKPGYSIEYIKSCFDQNDTILLSSPKHINREWRTIVDKNGFITGCQYRTFCNETKRLGFDPSSDCPQRVINFVNRQISNTKWFPDPIFVMDVVEGDRSLSVMELNALSTSGWYDCDYNQIINKIMEIY